MVDSFPGPKWVETMFTTCLKNISFLIKYAYENMREKTTITQKWRCGKHIKAETK